MSELMSQQAIDELIRISMQGNGGSSGTDSGASALSAMEIDTLGEIGNISMGSAATALHAILGRKVRITTPDVTVTTIDQLTKDQTLPYVVVDVQYSEGLIGNNLFILRIDDVKVITDIMMGGPGELLPGDLSELHLSAISEAMNQMMGGVATAMAELFGQTVNIAPPRTQVIRLSDHDVGALIVSPLEQVVRISFRMEIEGLAESSIMQLMPVAFGRQLVDMAMNPGAHRMQEAPFPPPAARIDTAASRATASGPVDRRPQIDVRPIELTSFDASAAPAPAPVDSALDLILDVPLQVTVELGQCRKSIREVLELNIGSVVALDTLAGEPVNVVVNGKCVAKGEVIVIDESYGIRITEVLSQRRIRMPHT